jgi:RimJ/RimL family protein N-acetyltransferase
MDRIPYPLELLTERLVIRTPAESDAAQLVEAIAETIDRLRPWMPWADHIPTLAEAAENCRQAEQAFRAGRDHRVHLFLRDSLTFVGGSGLHRIDWSVPKVEIGYWVRDSCTGKGYITEAVRELSRYALEELEANRVEIRMNATNAKSRGVAERLGFTLEGILRNHARGMDGSLRDTCIYATTPAGAAP